LHEHRQSAKGLRDLSIALAFTSGFFIIEAVGGFLTQSLALITAALHMLNDSTTLIFSIIAGWFAHRPITTEKTYGYRRAEVLAALLNGLFLWVIVVFIFREAIRRLWNPVEVQSLGMLVVSLLGLAANGLSAATLSRSKDENFNVKGAFLHVMADTLGSLGAISAGLIMLFTGWYQADSLISMAIGVLIFISSAKLVRESLNILLEGVPPQIDFEAVEKRLHAVEGVEDIHDLHLWCITPPECVMSAHVVVKEGIDRRDLMERLIHMLSQEFGIEHTTIQFEETGYPKAEDEHP